MSFRRAPVLLLTIVCALVLTACPAPTGRHRGIIDGAGGTCGIDMPLIGSACVNPSEQCVFNDRCGNGGFTNTTCTCLRGSWQCAQDMRCNMPPIDDGPITCPMISVHDHDTCSSRQGGLYCGGLTTNCSGTDVVTTYCFCTGSRWSCRPAACGSDASTDGSDGDAASVMCPEVPPNSGDSCMPGVQCSYPIDPCPWTCTCGSDSTFSCQSACAGDAGDADTLDASFDP